MTHQRTITPMLPTRVFVGHLLTGVSLALAVMLVSLGIGATGYHYLEHLPWIDAQLNAAMILTGMGPVDRPITDAGKVFASIYALFSGLVFLSVAAMVLTPVARRVMHRLHLDITMPMD